MPKLFLRLILENIKAVSEIFLYQKNQTSEKKLD